MTTDKNTDSPQDNDLDIVDSLEELIGNTPLLRLHKVAGKSKATILVKLESFNPGGSSKDRIAVEMIDAAERDGLLKPGGTIVEPTSGNTGVGLAIVAAQRGYKTIFVVTDKVSTEKIDLLRAYGSQVVVCPVAVEPEDPSSYYSTAERLSKEIPGSFRPDQYSNPNNPLAHEKTTGPEIWEQTAGRITHFVAGIGTGGTIGGVAKYLKSQKPDVVIVGADPTNSVYSGGTGRPYLTEGVGEDFWPQTFDPSLVDITIPITDREAFEMARRVAHEEGLLVGGSGALAIAAALKLENLTADDIVVILLPDTGRGYLSKIYNDEWMLKFGFLEDPDSSGSRISDLLRDAVPDAATDAIIYINPDTTVRQAIALMHEHDISQLPVAKNQPPFAAAELVGSVEEMTLTNLVFRETWILDQAVEKIMDPPLTTIGIGESIDKAVAHLEITSALVVLDGGLPITVISRSDLLAFFAANNKEIPGAK